MTQSIESTTEPVQLPGAITIQVIGVGDAGCNVVGHLGQEALTGVSFAAVNTNARSLAQTRVPRRLNLGAKILRGLGAGGDPERGRAVAEADTAAIRDLCEGADLVIVVAGLGGGTATGAAPVVARVARELGALVLAIVLLPFACEGTRRQRQAQLGLHELKKAADGVICVPNQAVFKLIDDNTSLPEAFELTNELVAQGLRGLWRLLSKPGLINVDFADLCAVAQGQHAESSLATAEARGPNRVGEVVEKLLAHPLLAGEQALSKAAGVLVSIVGGPGLTLAEVNRLMEQINREAEQAHIIMGAAVEPGLEDRLQLTVVASGTGTPEPEMLPPPSGLGVAELQTHLLDSALPTRSHSRFAAPPPELSPEQAERLFTQQHGGRGRARKSATKLCQGQLPLEIVARGRFEKSEPTIHKGQDLDVPTYVRRGVPLN